MSITTLEAVSKKNEHYISKQRYYELRHFALQYHEWVTEYNELLGKGLNSGSLVICREDGYTDKTSDLSIKLYDLKRKIDMIKQCAEETDHHMAPYIFEAAIENMSFNHLDARMEVPCSRDYFYKLYREFWWRLDKVRN